MVQMMRVHAPEKNCCKSRQPDSSRFAPRGFANRAEDKETASEHKPFPLDFDMTGLPLYPPVQAKLAGGRVGDGQENENVASSKGTGEKAPAAGQAQPKAEGKESNRTGMPDRLKAGIESLSGIDMSDVRVHANSPKPARLNALAYTQGNQIYMGPGQERHLPHEAWHAVQQAEGRVRPMVEIKGEANINDDVGLEDEATRMGNKAAKRNAKMKILKENKLSTPIYSAFLLRSKVEKGFGFVDNLSNISSQKKLQETIGISNNSMPNIIQRVLDRATIPRVIDRGQQDKHIANSDTYYNQVKRGDYKNYLTVDPQILLTNFINGQYTIVEEQPNKTMVTIDFGFNIGVQVDRANGEKICEVRYGKLVYGGRPHIFPFMY